MTITVEDGSIVTGANSYVTEAELTAYAIARGTSLTGDPEELLIKAMDYLESLEFKGITIDKDQPLQWPRYQVMLDGWWVDTDEIPQLLKDSQCEVAIAIDDDQDPLENIARVKMKETVGPISVEYAQGQATTIVRKINNKLKKLLKNSGTGGISFIVDRG